MKTLFSLSLLVLVTITANAQARDFDGIWSGSMTTSNDDEIELTLYIDDNNVYAVHLDEDGDRAKYKDHEVLWSKGFGEQLTFVWMDKGGVWTETQVYSLVWTDKNTLSVHHLRHVSNEDESYSNTDWGYTSKGTLRKE